MKCRVGIVDFKPDWSHLKQFYDLAGWKGEGVGLSCCPRCLANMKSIPADDVSRNAKWLWKSHSEFMKWLLESGRFVSILWSFPGFRLHSIINDWMHVMDLGVLLYTLGNSLDFLFIRIAGVRSRHWPFCRAMTTAIKPASRVCGQEKSPINKLTYGTFRPGKSKQPCLKCKSAHARHMLPLILYMFENIYFQEDSLGEVRLQMLNHCNDMYNSLYAWKETGSTAARDSMAHHGRMFLILYEELRNLAFTMKQYSHMWK